MDDLKGILLTAIIGLFIACFSMISFAAPAALPSSFDMQAVPLNTLVNLYFKEVNKHSYFICSDVLNDSRIVSVRASGKLLDAAMVSQVLQLNGYEAKEVDGFITVCKNLTLLLMNQAKPSFIVLCFVMCRTWLIFCSRLLKGRLLISALLPQACWWVGTQGRILQPAL